MKIILIILLLIITIYCYYLNFNEAFTNDEPVKIAYINTDKTTILTEGVFFKNPTNGQRKIPSDILNNVDNIIEFNIHPNYYALISINNSEPQLYRGTRFVQNYNVFKYITKIEIVKNITNLI